MRKVLFLFCLLLCVSVFASASTYYLTAGDQSKMTIVVNTVTHAYTQTNLTGTEYAIAVFPGYEVTVGAYQNNGAKYDAAGNFITTLNNANTIANSQWLDGTTDGTHNYTVDFWNGNVYQTDTIFNNPAVLFNVGSSGNFSGITYDGANNSLWLGDRWGNDGRITDYTLAGVPLSFFDTGIEAMSSLAYDSSDGTLWVTSTWDCTPGTCFYQYSTNGTLLNHFSIPVYDNIIGGEIANTFVPPVPEPGSLLLLGTGLLATFGALRRK